MSKEIKELDYDKSVALMKRLYSYKKYEKDVSVFVDRGWGDSGQVATYEIITCGNGQAPHARITKETFDLLLKKKIIGGNTLITYKARRNHPFLSGKKDKSTLGNKHYKDTQLPPVHSFFRALRGF
jgi:hypothetical protein